MDNSGRGQTCLSGDDGKPILSCIITLGIFIYTTNTNTVSTLDSKEDQPLLSRSLCSEMCVR